MRRLLVAASAAAVLLVSSCAGEQDTGQQPESSAVDVDTLRCGRSEPPPTWSPADPPARRRPWWVACRR